MEVFYNTKGIGDVLIIALKTGTRYEISHEKFGDITKITNEAKEVLGYNIFNASSHFELTETDNITVTEALVANIEDLFKKNKLDDTLDIDLSPKFVVGYVISKGPHENADKLSVCQVDVGEESPIQIVCGAANVDEDQKVVVAKVGATMPSGLKIEPTELRGVPSNGMICSRTELDLPDDPEEDGIYILDKTEEIGVPFIF